MSTAPFQAIAYLNIDHPVVAWCVYRGVLVSARVENHSRGAPVSMMFAGMLHCQDNVRLYNELLIEQVRAERFPAATSRLTGMYFFTDRGCADLAVSWGDHFDHDYLAELEVYPVRPPSVLDANWITYAPLDERGRIPPGQTDWIERYWSGEPFSDAPAWESIVDGRAVVWGTELRERAYEVVRRHFPAALDTLEVARIAANVGSDLGQVSARVTQPTPGRFILAHYMDFRDADNPEFLTKLHNYDGPKNMKDLAPGKATFGMPNFLPHGSNFTFSDFGAGNQHLHCVHREFGI